MLLLLLACQGTVPPEAPSDGGTRGPPPAPEAPAPPAFEGTVGIVDVPRTEPVATLLAVDHAAHEGFDRVVFRFAEGVPGYHVEYVDRPVRQCGSGEVTPVAGDAWLEVRLSPANAHTEEGAPTVAERDRALALQNAKQLVLTCDFEAVTTWVLGVGSPNPYRVLELADPPRLVVDVATRR